MHVTFGVILHAPLERLLLSLTAEAMLLRAITQYNSGTLNFVSVGCLPAVPSKKTLEKPNTKRPRGVHVVAVVGQCTLQLNRPKGPPLSPSVDR